ncbi:MAG: ribosome silencing factor [Phycisphaerales bacterium]
MTRTYTNADPEKVRGFAIELARLLADSKCTEVVLLDVRGHSQVCDYVVIGSGTSQRQMRAVAQQAEDLGDEMGIKAYRSSRDEGTTWIVVDFVETVVHLFEPDQRLYYDLELLWSGASRVEWKRPEGEAPRTRGAAASVERATRPKADDRSSGRSDALPTPARRASSSRRRATGDDASRDE